MSVVLAGPRRTYLLLLFWERLPGRLTDRPRTLASALVAKGLDAVALREAPRVVLALRLLRVAWRRMFGVSFFVLEPGQAVADRESENAGDGEGP